MKYLCIKKYFGGSGKEEFLVGKYYTGRHFTSNIVIISSETNFSHYFELDGFVSLPGMINLKEYFKSVVDIREEKINQIIS